MIDATELTITKDIYHTALVAVCMENSGMLGGVKCSYHVRHVVVPEGARVFTPPTDEEVWLIMKQIWQHLGIQHDHIVCDRS